MSNKSYYVYVLTNYLNSTLYIGVTNSIERRMYEHKNKLIEGFSSKYNLNKLVYVENYENIQDAIAREKQLKTRNRVWKIELIKKANPKLSNLNEQIPDQVWNDTKKVEKQDSNLLLNDTVKIENKQVSV